jgi:hypothetical protein
MLATGERRARVGDLAAGTMIVSTDGAPSAAPAEVAPAAVEVAPAAVDVAPLADELEPDGEELAEVEDHELAREYEPITGVDAGEEAEPVVEASPLAAEPVSAPPPAKPWVVKDEAADLTVVETQPRIEIVPDAPAEDSPPAPDHTLDVATPSLKELAQDVAAATGSEPRPRPLAEVEIGGPEIDVDEPQVTVRSVDTVSAIDLVMGADEPSEDRPAADEPPAGA